ncbi:MAG: DedA family protein [Dehalococcoidia bacterium]
MDDSPQVSDNPAVDWIKRNFNWFVLGFALLFVVLPRVSPYEGLNENINVFQRFTEWMLDRLETLFKDWGYYVVFLGVLAENSIFFGLIVPGSVILILGGLSAENGSINIWWVLGLGIAGTIIGDTLSYTIGRLGWTRALERGSLGDMIGRVRERMEQHTNWLILAYHFAGYSRVVGPTAAGLFRIPYRRWAPLDYAGGIAWVIAFTMLGVVVGLFGVEFGDTKTMVRLLELFFLVILGVMIFAAYSRTTRAPAEPDEEIRGGRPGAPVIIPVEDD